MKSVLIASSKAAVTGLLFFLLFRKVDFHQFGAVVRNARLHVLVTALLILWVGHYMCIFRWRMLMRPLMPVLSLGRLFAIYCIGLFFNLAFPTVIGGDVVKMYYAGKPSRLFAKSFAATFLDRDAGMFAMMLIACLAFLFNPVEIPGIPLSLIVWGVFAAFILANVVLFTPQLHRLLLDLLHRWEFSGVAAKIDAISNAFQVMGRQWSMLAWSLVISIVNQLLVIAVIWTMAVGLRIAVPLTHFMVLVPVITLISMIPVSLNGMGLREYAFLNLLGSIGVARESCIALGLLSSAALVVSAVPGGIVYLFFNERAAVRKIAALESDFS